MLVNQKLLTLAKPKTMKPVTQVRILKALDKLFAQLNF
jgi:hypothetical protein